VSDNDFNQVRVTEIVEIEIDIDDQGVEEPIMRFLVRSRTGDRSAVEFPYAQWQQIYETLEAARRELPGGRWAQ
jgi:hypothetical protein